MRLATHVFFKVLIFNVNAPVICQSLDAILGTWRGHPGGPLGSLCFSSRCYRLEGEGVLRFCPYRKYRVYSTNTKVVLYLAQNCGIWN